MISEDLVAAKLRGCNCYIQFNDGEYMPLTIDVLSDKDARAAWFIKVENFLNQDVGGVTVYFPSDDIALNRKTIKYVKIL
jgi:hypothetical protein